MNGLNRRLRDLFAPQSSSQHDWCDTTRLADPWSVLLGRRRPGPTERAQPEPAEPDVAVRDLRVTARTGGKDEQA